MKKRLISVEELEARAMKNVRNYEGAKAPLVYENGRNYNGMAPRAVAPTPKQFSMTITNTGSSAVDRSIAILPAYFTDKSQIKNAVGSAVDGIITEGLVCGTVVGNNNVQATGKPKSIDELLAFAKLNPFRVTGMKLKVDDTDQFSEDILIRKESPLQDLGFITKSPSAYENSLANNDKIVEIPLSDVQFDNQTSVITTIKAGRTMTITFFIGVIANQAAQLDQAVKSAGV